MTCIIFKIEKDAKQVLSNTAFIQKRSISDFVTNLLSILVSTTLGITTTLVNKMNPGEVGKYQNYLLVYWLHFGVPLLISGTITILYYVRHPPLRVSLSREVKMLLGL